MIVAFGALALGGLIAFGVGVILAQGLARLPLP